MSWRAVGIAGPPASGKSSLVRALIERLGAGTPGKASYPAGKGLAPILWTDYPITGTDGVARIVGVYDDRPYPGTDRLSMAAPAAWPAVFSAWCADGLPGDNVVVLEGARLLSARLVLEMLRASERTRILVLVATEAALAARRGARHDTKPPSFLKATATQARRVLEIGPPAVHAVANETPADFDAALARLRRLVEEGPWP